MRGDYWRGAGPRVISRDLAYAHGISKAVVDARLRAGQWRPLLPGVFMTRPEVTRRDLIMAAQLYAGPQSLVSGAQALLLHGIISATNEPILVLCPVERRPAKAGWLHVRPTGRLPAAVSRRGLRIAPVARAVADHTLGLRRLDDVRAVVARAVQRQLCSWEEIHTEYVTGPRHGSAHLRTALADVAAGAASAPEARAATALRRAGLEPFEQNARIDTPGGGCYFADFLWRELRAVLEIDSVEYHFNQADWARTLRRHRELEALGYSVIHLRPAEVQDEACFIAVVEQWLRSRRNTS